jgi:hypothetical protein
MRRRLKVLAACAAALIAVRMLAQYTGGLDSGNAPATAPDASGAAASPDNSTPANGATQNNGGNGDTTTPGGNTTNPGGNTTSPNGNTTNGNGNGGTGTTVTPPLNGTPGLNPGSSLFPPSAPNGYPPGTAAPFPGATPSPAPLGATGGSGQGGAQQAPVTFTLPGGYGADSGSQTFTLGQGRLSKPPLTFTVSVTQGYDDNLYDAPSHYITQRAAPTPTPPLIPILINYRITPPSPPTPVYEYVRARSIPTPTPSKPLGIIGSPESTVSLGIQIQKGTPRTVITADASVSGNYYYNRPGPRHDFSGSADLDLVQRLTPRATFDINAQAVYQNTPNFALVNAPTNGGNGGEYLDGSIKADITYAWSARLSTVTSYGLDFSIIQNSPSQNLYASTYGTQFRYTVSPRTVVTTELRQSIGIYPSTPASDTLNTYYLLGLDEFFSSRLRNTFSFGIETHDFTNAGGGQTLPYFESDTTLALPRGASLAWSNVYGSQESPTPSQTIVGYRTGLTYVQPLSTKLYASLSVAYNIENASDTQVASNRYRQDQFQASANLGYTVSPRLSLNLSYTYLDFITTQLNSSYTRDQVFLGGSYLFR